MEDVNSILAIDFGTTNSAVCVYRNNESIVVPSGTHNQQGSTLFPSYVEYTKHGVVVGSAAKNNFGRRKKYVVAAVKRIIGLTYSEYQRLQDKSVFGCEVIKGNNGCPRFIISDNGNTKSPVEVASEIFAVLKKEADSFTNRNYTKAYVTVPANFKDHQCRAIKEAARLAGLEVLKLITEPTAAAMSWCFEHPNEIKSGEKLMVYDFGGGTFDVSLVKCFGQKRFRIINTGGNPYLGGNDLDTSLVNLMIEKAKGLIYEDIELTNRAQKIIRNSCEAAKILITNGCSYNDDVDEFLRQNTKITYAIDFSDVSENISEIDLQPKELNNAIDKYVKETIDITLNVIKHEHFSCNDIKYVLLVGGSSHLHLVKQKMKQSFNTATIPIIDPDIAVVKGAMSMVINKGVEEKIVISYGLLSGEDEVALILEKGTVIPAKSKEVLFMNTQSCQDTISSSIYQWSGDPDDDLRNSKGVILVDEKECTKVNTLSFKNKYRTCKGKQTLAMIFKLDVGGTLEVICKDKNHNTKLASISYPAVYGGND